MKGSYLVLSCCKVSRVVTVRGIWGCSCDKDSENERSPSPTVKVRWDSAKTGLRQSIKYL